MLQYNMEQQSINHIGKYEYDARYCIGQGSFGKVYKGVNKQTKRNVAIKEMDGQLVSQIQINKQIAILKTLKHKNIVEYEDAFQSGGNFYIVTEYCNGGDLRSLLDDSDNEINIDKIMEMFFQVCSGFVYLRKFNVIHRDLKPSNILIHNSTFKIADFGVAKTQQLNKSIATTDLIGVPIYMSPQILSRNYYTFKCDIWSIGVIIYQLFFDRLPWRATDVEALFFQIMTYPTPYLHQKKKMPTIIKKILDGTLKYLEKERMTWEELSSLERTRKKIFDDGNRSKSISETKHQPISHPLTIKSNQGHNWGRKAYDNNMYGGILHHIKVQFQSLQQQLLKIINNQCYNTFINAVQITLQQGPSYWQCFLDNIYITLKMAASHLHIYMIQLQCLEAAREMLVLLELLSDMLQVKENSTQQTLQKKLQKSKRNIRIDQYAAEVISKINTLCIDRTLSV